MLEYPELIKLLSLFGKLELKVRGVQTESINPPKTDYTHFWQEKYVKWSIHSGKKCPKWYTVSRVRVPEYEVSRHHVSDRSIPVWNPLKTREFHPRIMEYQISYTEFSDVETRLLLSGIFTTFSRLNVENLLGINKKV